MASTWYTRPDGHDLLRHIGEQSRSDTTDAQTLSYSADGGRTWSEPEDIACVRQVEGGIWRKVFCPGYVDPLTGAYLTIWMESVRPTDNPLEALRTFTIHYGVSGDGGRTFDHSGQIIQAGDAFDADHPLPGVWRGRNCYMIGDKGCRPITLSDGTLLQPIQISPIGPSGQYEKPRVGYTFTDAAVLRGHWRADGDLDWTLSDRVSIDPEQSSRGMIEPTLGLLHDGRVLMVLRGANDGLPGVPGRRWFAISEDNGQSFATPHPWCYDDGEYFYSPSSCSQLLMLASGQLVWIGNITPENPTGNRPRYPLVIGEVDRHSGLLRRDTVTILDDRGPDDSELLTLSNFYARQDRATGDIVLHMSRLFAQSRETLDWTADAMLYRIAADQQSSEA